MDDAKVGTLKVSELKAELQKRGLPTKGIKSALQKRLREALASAAPAATPAATASSGMDVEETKQEDEETIDESVRFKGTVVKFFKRRGFGTICPDGKDKEKKEDLVFVHWRQIQSSDEWPSLSEGQVVEYYLGEKKNPRKENQKIFAAKVTLQGGQPVSQADDRVFPDRSQRFVGIVEFFDARKGFGFVKPKEDFCFDEQDFVSTKKGTIYVCREDIKTADSVDTSPSLKDKAEVEFTLYKRPSSEQKHPYCAGDVTKVGGEPLGAEDFKKRGEGRRRHNNKGKKGKKGKRNFMQMMMGGGMPMMMGGGMPMMMGGMGGAQLVQMNGQTFMMMPAMGGKKKRRKNKNKKKKQQA